MLRVAENLPSTGFQGVPQRIPQRVSPTSSDRILVVEDDRAVQRALRRLFEAEGYTVLAASDGKEAVDLFRSTIPSAVVLDLRLPGLSGREVCGELKQHSPAIAEVTVVPSVTSYLQLVKMLSRYGPDPVFSSFLVVSWTPVLVE